MERKYDATYRFGKTVVHVVAPQPMTEEQKQAQWREEQAAFWHAWKGFSTEQKLEINERVRQRKLAEQNKAE